MAPAASFGQWDATIASDLPAALHTAQQGVRTTRAGLVDFD